MKEQAKQKLRELVDRFRNNLDVYKKSTYNETQVRREFIDPFFEALGWDVSNKQGFAEQYKEVVHEDVIKVGRSIRAPDYSFRIGGQRKFFVEAKKPAVNIKADVSPSYQLRRYAWSAKLPLSVVTDFEEFSVFDCQIKPSPKDKPGVGRIAYYTFEEYLDKFDEIYDVFSKEAVLKGSFDRYAQSTKGKKGTAEVDSEFLKEIESWRELLAKNIALRNPDVSIYELNYAVQKIIDRIIFLRICEDRGIEPYGQLQTKAVESGDVYMHLLNHFKLAESKYNSGIFDFDADKITPTLSIDDRVLKTIIQSLYYPKSPYEFSVLGVEILGNVYEQFLGKVIRLTAGHQAKVETKPEVKKAGGVYYTPQYIVDYIVKNTVGKLVEGKTPEEIAGMKILDPACGSGSFLIGAYTYLLQYHLDWYVNNEPKKHKEAVFQVRENEWYLTTAEKKRILLNNIFGVDIDPQAVEVTKLSLLLKVLEHESRESIDQQVKLGLEGVLPNLVDNIKCGNSLIGSDFYGTGQQERLFDEAEMRRVNVFDWDDERKGFGGIMKRGGFDCVIGNPPWVDIKGMDPELVDYYFRRYSTTQNRMNIYATFIQRSLKILSKSGMFGFITPSSYLTQSSYTKLRKLILENTWIQKLVRLPDNVFTNVKAETAIVILEKNGTGRTSILLYNRAGAISEISKQTCASEKMFPQKSWLNSHRFIFNIFITENIEQLLRKIESVSLPLQQFCDFSLGLTPYDKYKGHTQQQIKSRVFHSDYKKDETFKPLLSGADVSRYRISWESEEWISYGKWLGAPREQRFFTHPRIIVRQIISGEPPRIFAGYTEQEFYNAQIGFNLLLKREVNISLKFLLALINSRLMTFYHRNRFLDQSKRVFQKILIQDAKKFPIHTLDFSNPTDKAQHDKLVALVESMLELQRKYHETRIERDKELYERQIKIVDAQIDRLVYDLYGLTEEEVRVVEKNL
ncbi:MAG: N-6 DNA methylase [Methanophagales archaeon]|nr:N-6 DNA methylase [Methanophagales archaeon]